VRRICRKHRVKFHVRLRRCENVQLEWQPHVAQAGIVDPLKVARSALENAASMASVFLTTECSITDLPKKEGAGPAMPPGGGMPMGMGM